MKSLALIAGLLVLLLAVGLPAEPPAEPKAGNRLVSAWIADLDNTNALIRDEAIEVLAQLGPAAKAALPKLEKLAQSESPELRTRAALAIKKIGGEAKPARDALMRLLQDKDSEKRWSAIFPLQQLGAKPNELIPALMEMLFDANATVRNGTANTLQNYGVVAVPAITAALEKAKPGQRLELLKILAFQDAWAEPALATVRPFLKDDDPQARMQALRILCAVDTADPDVVPTLLTFGEVADAHLRIEALQRADHLVVKPKELEPLFRTALKETNIAWRCQAAASLYETNPETAKEVMQILLNVLKADERSGPLDASAVLQALGRLGPEAKEAIPALLDLLQNKNGGGRLYNVSLAYVFARIGPSAVDPLYALLAEPNPQTVRFALQGLALLGPAAAEKLPAALESKDATVRRNALNLAVWLGPRLSDKALPTIIECLKDSNAGVRQAAVIAIYQTGPAARAAVPALIEILKNEKVPLLCVPAAQALGRIGPAAKDALPDLKEACKDAKAPLRLCAAEAIGLIDPKAGDHLPVLLELIRAPQNETTGVMLPQVVEILAKQQRDIGELLPALEDFRRNRADAASGASLANVLLIFYSDAPAALPLLQELLKDPNVAVRREAAFALCAYGGNAAKSAAPELVQTLRENDPALQQRVQEACEQAGAAASEALPLLLDRWQGRMDQNARLQLAAAILAIDRDQGQPVVDWLHWAIYRPASENIGALRVLCKHNPKNPELHAILQRMLHQRSLPVQLWALELIGELRAEGKPFLPDLKETLKDPAPDKRMRAAFAVLRIEGKNDDAVRVLAAALKGEDPLLPNHGQRMHNNAAQAARCLAEFGPAATAALPALEEAQFLGDPNLTFQAQNAIRKIGKK